ncbi:hypothetical protein E1264_34825 [Actinomadura sp. KC216]|uniref:hypothetical protein n=1 Tax=Actinomadura sp. KC216 TaxID=2530370 RepID=UPI001048A0A0|nr:hypothetical protein [Actinomadura sp. KC216]TDB79922.1 hypothetical protein E1264_34825 [Actinomadura sp. KC216]
MGWKGMQEWSKASTLAIAFVLSGSLAWAAFGPDVAGSGTGESAWQLPASSRPVIADTAARQLVTLNTMDPARVDQHLDAWERATTAAEHDRLRRGRAATRARMLRERETLSAARVSTVVPMSALGPDGTGQGRAYLMAVVRLTSAKPGGPPVERVRRLRVFMLLTPHGWRISDLMEAPGGGVLWLSSTVGNGPPSREFLMLQDARRMMTDLARGEGRAALTGSAVADRDRIWRRAGAPGGTGNGQAVDVGIIRQDDDSAELLVYLNLGITETVTEGYTTKIVPSERGDLALRVTIVRDGSGWRISGMRNA